MKTTTFPGGATATTRTEFLVRFTGHSTLDAGPFATLADATEFIAANQAADADEFIADEGRFSVLSRTIVTTTEPWEVVA